MKTTLAKYLCSLLSLATIVTATAQSTWNYTISDAGGSNSLVTWNVTGSLATSPGAALVIGESSLALSVSAPGIYADSYAGSGTLQAIPTPDGSTFQYTPAGVFAPLTQYNTANAPGNGNDNFALIAFLSPHTGPGMQLLYLPGMQSVLIPVPLSSFNPGTYQSQDSGFDTALTVNLTVQPVPEPSTPGLIAFGFAIGAAFAHRKGKSRAGARRHY